MSQNGSQRPLLIWAGMAAACVGALVFAVASVRSILNDEPRERIEVASVHATAEPLLPRSGVRGEITAGGVTVTRDLPSLAMAVRGEQTLDPRLPPGPFTGRFVVQFHPGVVREAHLGADLRGGSLIIRRRGEVLLSTYAGDEMKTALTTTRVAMAGRNQQLEFEYTADDGDVHGLRAVWQPADAMIPLPLPSSGAPLIDGPGLRGEALVQQHNCVACHPSQDPARQQRLARSPGPVLGDVGARARPSWIRAWLTDPSSVKSDANMPRMFHGAAADAAQIEDLTHYLASLGGPIEVDEPPASADLELTGRTVYHEVGCFACHGPLESPEAFGAVPSLRSASRRTYTALGDAAAKTTVRQLAAFLRDPLATRPSGRMPSMDLTAVEAEAIAAYLVAQGGVADAADRDTTFALEPSRVARGGRHFADLGCIRCHELGPNRTTSEPTSAGPNLESLPLVRRGCIAPQAAAGVPRFELSDLEVEAIGAYLAGLPARRSEQVPIDDLALATSRLNCTACHEVYGDPGPEPALLSFFTTKGEADLGDEGRLPPSLTDVAARLNGPWLREVLEGDGRARPYLATRMPKFGEANVHELPAALAAAAGMTTSVDDGPEFDGAAAGIGRELVGAQDMNCIQCHTVAGNEATGTPGPDLALATERLRYRAFSRWLHDPANVRPGTRMPSFFVGGYSGFTDLYGGRAQDQIDAMWAYLSQGEHLPLPDGFTNVAGLQLSVEDEPVVFRTFMTDAGWRAIAVGFPQQLHCAFDGESCRLAVIWQGQFLNAKGAWAARGGSETNPQNVLWKAPDRPLLDAPSGAGGGEVTRRFRGYRLDEQRRPIFRYDLSIGERIVHVEDQPFVTIEDARPRMLRRLDLSGESGVRVIVDPGGHVVRTAPAGRAERGDGSFEVVLGAEPTRIVLEVTW